MPEFSVQVTVDGEVGVLNWSGATDQATLDKAVSLAADDCLIGRGLRRIEVSVPVTDSMAIRAVHRAGFRREGRRRSVVQVSASEWVDALLYSRLDTDQVYGLGGFSAVMNTVLPTHRVIAHVLMKDDAGRVLLLQTSYKDDWELPGGVVEAGEPPRIGAEREVYEELGLQCRFSQPLLVDWMPPYEGWDDAVEFIFDGGVLSPSREAQIRLADGEIVSRHWVDPAELSNHVFSLSARRLSMLLSLTHPWYTENGRPLPR